MSPKSSFLNAPRGLFLYLIDPIMTSDECQRLYVIKYSDFLIRISLFPQSSVHAFLTLFSELSFLSGIYFFLFSILMNVLSVTLKLPVYKNLWYILDWICQVTHYGCGKSASQICKRITLVHFYFNYSPVIDTCY